MFARSMKGMVKQMSKAMTLSEVITGMINELDLVSVVRCKDCKYKKKKNGERITIPVHENCYSFTAYDFCSYGERKDGDSE